MHIQTHAALSRLGLRRDALALEMVAWSTVAVAGTAVVLATISMPRERETDALLEELASGQVDYRLAFVAATLVGPLLFASLALFSWIEHRRRSLRPVELIGWGFLVSHLSLPAVAYASQFTPLSRSAADDPAAAATWLFYGETSIPLLLAAVGYGLFGIGALLVSTVLTRRRGLVGWTGWLLAVIGVVHVGLMVAAVSGWIAAGQLLMAVTVLVVPLAVLLGTDGRGCRREERRLSQHISSG